MTRGKEYSRDDRYLTTRITADGRDGFPVEPGRYRLVVSRACPWAGRAVIVRRLLGLEAALPMAVAGPLHDERSWRFDLDPGGRDPVLGIERLQEAYADAYERLFGRLDRLSTRLQGSRYLVGDTITEADVRLFTTLVRFDAVYHGHCKCNRQKLSEMPVIWAYARDLFQTPGFGDTVDFDHIKRHYFTVHDDINPTGIVPLGPDLSGWLEPHGRAALGGRPFGDGTPPGPVTAAEAVPADHTPLTP
ncbi:glutathione S-transferase C-terminal domain-containing protein [Streptomyces sp. NBC_00069]|uniref:glutathione S-transferase C-terminal domain-containing protein n=1 Tax=Streptomyces sp. NBC_00069 TaxID=2975639 RepID=UPI0032478409|nr:glutathione S-transferase C-terminal domain-containing protein [Streptomyces sp. NBC_00998]